MKKFFILATVVAIFTSFILVVTPAQAATGRSLTLVSVQHWHNKGLVLKFEVTGEFSPQELAGFARIGDHEFGMDCNFDDDSRLTCVIGDAIAQYIGQSGVVFLGGERHYFSIPGKKVFAPPEDESEELCYDVWALLVNDLDEFNAAIDSEVDPLTLLVDYTHPEVIMDYCQDVPAQDGDIIDFTHPQQTQMELLFGADPGDMSEFPGVFIEDVPAEFDGCLPTSAYHGMDSLFWHISDCSGGL